MKANRGELLAALRTAAVGAARPPRAPTHEQSDCFCFTKDEVVCFNDEIATRTPTPLPGIEGACAADDLLRVLEKLPDAEVEIERRGAELQIRGERKSAGIVLQAQVLLPFDGVPKPGKWEKLRPHTADLLKQAARTCGRDLSNPLTTVVHATPDKIEACDNFRLFRAKARTGISERILIPAAALAEIEDVPIHRASVRKGWMHFRTTKKPGGACISIRCLSDDYVDLDKALAIKDARAVALPENLAKMLERSEAMHEGADPLVRISVEAGRLAIRAEKETGWYREQKKCAYRGEPIRFRVNPDFLADVLRLTTNVQIGDGKMRIESDGIEFVVALEAPEDKAEGAPAEGKKPKAEKAKKAKKAKKKVAVEA